MCFFQTFIFSIPVRLDYRVTPIQIQLFTISSEKCIEEFRHKIIMQIFAVPEYYAHNSLYRLIDFLHIAKCSCCFSSDLVININCNAPIPETHPNDR